MKKYIICLGVLLVGVVIGWLCRSPRPKEVAETQRDTVFVRDTVREYYPVEVVKETKETIQVAVTDTVRVRDTLYMNLQTEKKIYRGEDYYAEVSGYRPSLDRIDVYPKTTTITQTITQQPKTWAFSLDLGLDVGRASSRYITPNLSAEIGYKRWAFKGEAGVSLSMQESYLLSPSIYFEGGLKYSLIKR